jgi:hypothetical protein
LGRISTGRQETAHEPSALAPPMVHGENLTPPQFRNSDKVSARNYSLVSLERVWHMRAGLVGSAVLMPIQSCRRTKRRHVCRTRGGPVLEDEDQTKLHQ